MELRVAQSGEVHDPAVLSLQKMSMILTGWVGQSSYQGGEETNLGPCEI